MPPLRSADNESFVLEADKKTRLEAGAVAPSGHVQNELLRALPMDERMRVLDAAEYVPLKSRQTLIEANLSVLHAYFPETGIASVLAGTGSRKPMEVCAVGCRGFVGIPIVLGTGRSPMRVVVQLKGHAWRIPAADFERLLDECVSLRKILHAHIQGSLVQEAMLNVCNAGHTVPERICRWLLMARHRMQSDAIPATHDLIARMLGVRRPGVTAALGNLEKNGIIRLTRGNIHIARPRALDRCACRCAHRIETEYERLLELTSSDEACGNAA